MKKMSFITTLMAGACLAAPVLAEDITSPFYVPGATEYFSTTSLGLSRTSYKNHEVQKDMALKEEFQIGVGEEASIVLALGNRFNMKHHTNRDYNNDLNLDYELGARKAFVFNNSLMVRLGASYDTYNPRSWYGRSSAAKDKIRAENGGNTRWHKELRGNIAVGYELEDMLIPYASLGVNGNIDEADRELEYEAFAGIHKTETRFSYDVGLRYAFEFGSDNEENWFMQVGSDYFLTDSITIGGAADYRFAGSSNPKIDYNYNVEARLKILF